MTRERPTDLPRLASIEDAESIERLDLSDMSSRARAREIQNGAARARRTGDLNGWAARRRRRELNALRVSLAR